MSKLMHKVVNIARGSRADAVSAPPAPIDPSRSARMAQRAAARLGIGERRARFLVTLFDPSHYRRVAGLDTDDAAALFEHYLERGIADDLAPSTWFDPHHVARALDLLPVDEAPETAAADEERTLTVASRTGAGEPRQVPIAEEAPPPVAAMRVWLERGFESVAGVAWFDETLYRAIYPDIDGKVDSAYAHFVEHGRHENRAPCRRVQELAGALHGHFPGLELPVTALIESIPAEHVEGFLCGSDLDRLSALFMPALYRAALGLEDEVPLNALFARYVALDWRAGLRPSVLFHEGWYRELVAGRDDVEPIDDRNPYLHWFYIGRHADLVPTPMFEPRHYLDVHQDIRRAFGRAPFEHYLADGVREPRRSASVHFDAAFYKSQAGKLVHDSPLLDYVVRGQHLGLSPIPGLDLAHFAADDPWRSSPAEEAAIAMTRRIGALERAPLAELIADVERLEPQIVRPYGPRRVRMPPMVHPDATITAEAAGVVAALEHHRYDSVVLIPHCRMAGSAKVSGALIGALARLTDRERVLIVTTDLSVFERAEWFPEDVALLDFSAHLADAPLERRVRALLDLVRGLRPRRLININSNLGWQLTTSYGRQLAEWMHLYVYLFCWDLDFKGNKGGYPIQWFLPTFDHCSAVFTDDATLRAELVERYAPSPALAERFVTLYEPATDRDIDYRDAIAQRATRPGKRRVFWCGRFDRQKRLDLLVATARAMPDVEFMVWGKRVLDDGPDYFEEAPENIRLMGAYECIDDVPIASCDAFLYTSAWDGMPSVLIEMASRNIPVVASEVGGVGELITEETGWPIREIDDVDAYVSALEALLADPAEAISRATRLREHTLALCTQERYEASLQAVLARESDPEESAPPIRDDADTLAAGLVSDSGVTLDGKTVDVSAVLTAHGEGALAAVTYRNFENVCAAAEERGLVVERIVMLDRPDARTRVVFDGATPELRIVETDFGDQGAVRNLAATLAAGEYLAFIDGDDLWGGNWLHEAHRFLAASPDNVIAHPEFCRFFSGVQSVFVNIDQEDPAFREDFLRHANYYDAMCMARRTTHLAFPYCKRRIRDGFAFEDWHWNCETIAGGQVHKIVPDTIHFKRRRQTSQTMQASGNRSLMPATALTDYARYVADETAPATAARSGTDG